MKTESIALFSKRRSQYAINNKVTLSNAELTELVGSALQQAPSAFNSQTQTLVLLLDKEHEALWDITMETLRIIIPTSNFGPTEAKINSFKAGKGTVLYFTDTNITKGLQEKFPLYADNFPLWALQENGMVQYAVWVALAENGIGATLQHYNPLIDEEVKKRWGIAKSWNLLGQMPFGGIVEAAQPRDLANLSEKLKVF